MTQGTLRPRDWKVLAFVLFIVLGVCAVIVLQFRQSSTPGAQTLGILDGDSEDVVHAKLTGWTRFMRHSPVPSEPWDGYVNIYRRDAGGAKDNVWIWFDSNDKARKIMVNLDGPDFSFGDDVLLLKDVSPSE